MPSANAFQIAVLPGDGIGPEVMAPCLQVLAAAEKKVGGFSLSTTAHPAGAGHYRDHGEALAEGDARRVPQADAILLGGHGPAVRALSRRHGNRAADRPALRSWALRRRPAGEDHSRPAAGAGRSARGEARFRAGARVDRRAVRDPGQRRGGQRSRRHRNAGHHARASASACSISASSWRGRGRRAGGPAT